MSDHREHRRVCCADAARRYLAALATPLAPTEHDDVPQFICASGRHSGHLTYEQSRDCAPTEDATPHDVRGHFPFHEYPHPTDHTHAAPTEDACTCGPYAPCPLHDAPTEDATLDARTAPVIDEYVLDPSPTDRRIWELAVRECLARSAPITESALAERVDKP